MTDMLKAMEGTWTLVAPNGRQWQAPTPIQCLRAELNGYPEFRVEARMMNDNLKSEIRVETSCSNRSGG